MDFGKKKQLCKYIVKQWSETIAYVLDTWSLGTLDQFIETSYKKPKIETYETVVLPKPVETLIQTLHDLKLDIVREKYVQYQNIQDILFSYIETYIQFLCETMKLIENFINRSKEQINWNTLQQKIKDLELEYTKKWNVEQRKHESFLDWSYKQVTFIETELHNVILERVTRKPNVSTFPIQKTVERTQLSVEHSEQIRKRLHELESGHLSSLFDLPDELKNEEQNVNIQLQTRNGNSQKEDKLTEQLFDIRKLQNFYQTMKYHDFESLRESVRELIKISLVQIHLHEKQCITFLENVQWTYQKPEELANIDQKIQREIRLLVSTITVQKEDLNIALTNIKNDCINCEENLLYEHETNWNTKLASLRLHLLECMNVYLSSISQI